MLQSGTIKPEARKRFEEFGIDLDQLLKCLCEPSRSQGRPTGPVQLADQLLFVRDKLNQVLLTASRDDARRTAR